MIFFHSTPLASRPLFWRLFLLAGLVGMGINSIASAGSLRDSWIRNTGNRYELNLLMQLNAPVRSVHQILTDYAHLDRLNPVVTQSKILPSAKNGVTRLGTTLKGCVAFFCKQFQRVEDIREPAPGRLYSEIVPELSDFKSGKTEWTIQRSHGGSLVRLRADMEPDFFIPPLIGSYFVKRALYRQALISLDRLECFSQIQARLRQAGSC